MGVLSKYLVFATGASVVQESEGITLTSGSKPLILNGPGAAFTADGELKKRTIKVSDSAQLTAKQGLNVDELFLEDASATVKGKLVVNNHLAVSGNARLVTTKSDLSSTKNIFLLGFAKYEANGSLKVKEQIEVFDNAELLANGSLSAKSLILKDNANVIAKGVLQVSKEITVDRNATLTANSLILREGAVVVAKGNLEVTNTATFFENTNVAVNELNLRDGSVVTANGELDVKSLRFRNATLLANGSLSAESLVLEESCEGAVVVAEENGVLDVKSLRLHEGARFKVNFAKIENIYFSSIKVGGPQLVVDEALTATGFWNESSSKTELENIHELINNRQICGDGSLRIANMFYSLRNCEEGNSDSY